MALTVNSPVPILLFGERDQMQGEVWLANSAGSSVDLIGGSLQVNFAVPETGPITFPSGAAIPPNAARRLALNLAISPSTPAGVYGATVTIVTAAGSQAVAAQAIVAGTVVPALGPAKFTFTGVTAATTFNGTIIVRNRGNTPFTVNQIPDENLAEVVVAPQVLEVGAGGAVLVEPAPAATAGGTVAFTNPTPTLNPGEWAQVDFQLTTPAALAADRHFRVMPRIITERFVVDLLT
jgi:hypothetical protein